MTFPTPPFCGPQLLGPDPAALVRLLVLAPLLEEWVLRAGVHEWWLRRHLNATAGLFTCALLFCVLHTGAGWQAALAVGGPALVLGMVYQRWRSWPLCAAGHSAMNAFALAACN